MAAPNPGPNTVKNLSLSLKAQTANKNMAANQPMKHPNPSKPGL
jgi:hypothetical protein